jgi:Raf kinase inhibitor-like YbhB/YbcL family protein
VTHRWRALSSVAAALTIVSVAFLLGCPRSEQFPEVEPIPEEPVPPGGEPAPSEEVSEASWQLTSSAFAHGESIPAKYTADGGNLSPPLSWTEPPEGAVELALICDDPDAPAGVWNHWVLYGLSPDLRSLEEGLPTDATVFEPALKQGITDFRRTGYGGPSPPPGEPHRYQFTLYALSDKLDLGAGASKQQVLDAMEGKVLATAMLEGSYGR